MIPLIVARAPVCRQGDTRSYVEREVEAARVPSECKSAFAEPSNRELVIACFKAVGVADPESDPDGATATLNEVLRRALWLAEAHTFLVMLAEDHSMDCGDLATELNTKVEHENPHPDGMSFQVVDGAIVLR